MRIVLNHFLKQDFNHDYLDRVTGRGPNQWTWTTQIVVALNDLGLEVRYHTKAPLEPFLEGEAFMLEHFGEAVARKMLEHSNWPVVERSMREVIDRRLYSLEPRGPEELRRHLDQGHVPIVLVDQNLLDGEDGIYQGHALTVTGYDDHGFTCHDCGPGQPTPHLFIPTESFERARNAPGTDGDLVVVFRALRSEPRTLR